MTTMTAPGASGVSRVSGGGLLDSCATRSGREWHGTARYPPEFRRKVLDLVEAGRSVT
jgi:hypothetical protein